MVKLRPEILATPPYRQGKPAGADAFKLSSNENPFPPLPGVLEAVMSAVAVNRYPDASALALREVLAERHGLSVDEVHVGAGSVALLSQLITAAAGPGDEVVYAWRSFEAYPGLVTVAGATSVQIPNRPDHSHDLEAMAAAVTERTRVVIVCSPNNPTGTVVSADEIDAFLDRIPSDVLVLLDEAYAEFVTGPGVVDGLRLVGTRPNLVVLRTFSKAYGLAGLRIGWAAGPAVVLDAARAAAIPLSVTEPAQQAAIASLRLEDELLARVRSLVALRDSLAGDLRAAGLAVPEAHGNFLWIPAGDEATRAGEILVESGVVARVFPGEGVRVSVGEDDAAGRIVVAAARIVEMLPAHHPARRTEVRVD
ncbi:aminotransferase class I/II-fold pyridoxal phosphate-dependent enzyme [Labedella populi]|uniref:Aromatic amino acid aminotransferase n=1 Tax=Labedella populi TaxID=2498850 RepID=A0A3S4DUC5_9MICO|nr:histidinol-phosphate transaminase [Labedella populi]RWZ59373.1 aminotransferase class I/II-fold pyridoxal phosphate-dependent enzyme [Labedella populi]